MWRILIIFILVSIIATLGTPFNYKLKFPNMPPIQIGGESCKCNPVGDERKRCPMVKCKTQGLVLKYFETNQGGSTGVHFKTEAHNNSIDYNWSGNDILNSDKVDNVKLQFTGLIRGPATSAVEFRSQSDDGVRLFVDNQPIIDQWKLQGATYATSPPIPMVKNEYYPFKLEWYEHNGGATLKLAWRYAGSDWKTIPSNAYYYNDGDYKKAPKPKQVNYFFRGAKTNANDWGGGNMVYLDRHNVNCHDDGLNQFHLRRPKKNQINYNYRCLDGVNSSQTAARKTGSNDWGAGNTIFLDRHTVNCGKNPISSFRLERPAKNKIRYAFTCSKKKTNGRCRNLNTGWNQQSRKNIYLDRHNVQCGNKEVITQFNLTHNGKGKMRYNYKCCKM
jgi:hypothetical protein